MAEGTEISEETRKQRQRHSRRAPEAQLMEGVAKVLNVFDLAQPEPIDSPEAVDIKQQKSEDALEAVIENPEVAIPDGNPHPPERVV